VAMQPVSAMPSSHLGRAPPKCTSGSPASSGRRYTAPFVAKWSVAAETRMSSPENATAEQYDACRPACSTVQVAPASTLTQRPIAAAAVTTPGRVGCARAPRARHSRRRWWVATSHCRPWTSKYPRRERWQATRPRPKSRSSSASPAADRAVDRPSTSTEPA